MTIKDRVQALFEKYSVELEVAEKEDEKTESMATAELDSGQVIQTDAEAFSPGVDVYVVNDEGEKIPLPDGEYTMADGTRFMVTEGKIAQAENEETPEPVEAEEDDKKEEEEKKEEAEEDEEKKKEEMKAVDPAVVAELIKDVKSLQTQLASFKKERETLSAAKPLAQQQKKKKTAKIPADLGSMSVRDRVRTIHNQFNQVDARR